MEPEGSSPYSKQPATCPYPEPDQSSLCTPPSKLSKTHFNIIFPWFRGFLQYFVTYFFTVRSC
jgi:hypothetical protein